MEEEKEKKITTWLIDNVFRNEKYYMLHDEETLWDMMWDLMEIIASLHNEYYRMVWGDYYDYMGHWTNKEIGGWLEADLFKNI